MIFDRLGPRANAGHRPLLFPSFDRDVCIRCRDRGHETEDTDPEDPDDVLHIDETRRRARTSRVAGQPRFEIAQRFVETLHQRRGAGDVAGACEVFDLARDIDCGRRKVAD